MLEESSHSKTNQVGWVQSNLVVIAMAIHDIDILVKLVNRCIARYALPLWSSSMLICHSHIVYPSTDPQILNFHHSNLPNAKYMKIPLYYFYPTPKWCHLYSLRLLGFSFQNHSPGHLLPVHNLRGPHADLGQLLVVFATREPWGYCIQLYFNKQLVLFKNR